MESYKIKNQGGNGLKFAQRSGQFKSSGCILWWIWWFYFKVREIGTDSFLEIVKQQEDISRLSRGRPILFNRLFLTDTDTDLFSITDTDI